MLNKSPISALAMLLAVPALVALSGCADKAPEQSGVTHQRLVNSAAEPQNWFGYGGDYGEQHFSTLDQINSDNVDQLGLAWTFKYDLDRVVEGIPVVADGVMYTTSAFSIVHALDAVTGELLWKYDPEVFKAVAGTGCCDAANRGVALLNDKVFVGVYDGRLEALDAATGELVWSVDTVIDAERNYTISGAPRVVKDKVIIGNGGAEFGVRGYITAYDANTGEMAWRFYTVPGDPSLPPEDAAMAMAQKTWFGDSYWEQGGGGTVWDSMAYDPELDLFYIGVGNGSLWNYKERSEAKGDNLFLSSIVALRPDTGEYVWHYQTTPGDAWDYTATQTITVATLPIDGEPRRVVMQAPKNGFFYVIDAATGELISAEKFGYVTWAKGVDPETGRPIVDNDAANYWETGEGKVVFPGSQGAHNWNPMSYSPITGLVYIPQQVTLEHFVPLAADEILKPKKYELNIGMVVPVVPETPEEIAQLHQIYRGKLQAWDPIKQQEVWSHPHDHISNGGTLATAGNLVFQGTADGRFVAYAADSGEKLWEVPVSSGVGAGPMTYEVDGEQYVAVNVGYGGSFGITFGALSQLTKVLPDSRLYVFKLQGDQPLPEFKRRTVKMPPLIEPRGDQASLENGERLYGMRCAACHGFSVISGGLLPDLRMLTPEKHDMYLGTLMGALQENGMPSFADRLSVEEMTDIQNYLIKRSHDLRQQLKEAGFDGE